MSQINSSDSPDAGKGNAFFDRADQVAGSGNWDFAIELYLEGIAREPDNFHRGHQKLREVALKRTAQGGKSAGMLEKLKRRAAKDDPISALTTAEYFLAKEPGSDARMEHVLKAAQALNLTEVSRWISEIMLESQRQAPKPSKRLLMVLTEAFAKIEAYAAAVQACEMALKLSPADAQLQDTLQSLGARYTIKKGKYDQEGSFDKGVKDMAQQRRLIEKDALTKDADYLKRAIEEARAEYESAPTVPGKVMAYADALLAPEDETLENQAIEMLLKTFEQTKAYQYRMRVGDIRSRQIVRRRRAALEAGDTALAAELAREQLKLELGEWTERAANYPTDLSIKYELGRRQLAVADLDGAIASFQAAQRDPRRHVQALSFLGQAFARKRWFSEAAETFSKVLEEDLTEDRVKDLRYNLGDVMEKMDNLQGAQEQYSAVAMVDYNYKDVRQRLESVRKRLAEKSGQ